MNEQAILDLYNLAKSNGYSKSIEEFKNLLKTNENALNDMYDISIQNGYKKGIDDFKILVGATQQPVAQQPVKQTTQPVMQLPLKKKEGSTLPSGIGTLESSGIKLTNVRKALGQEEEQQPIMMQRVRPETTAEADETWRRKPKFDFMPDFNKPAEEDRNLVERPAELGFIGRYTPERDKEKTPQFVEEALGALTLDTFTKKSADSSKKELEYYLKDMGFKIEESAGSSYYTGRYVDVVSPRGERYPLYLGNDLMRKETYGFAGLASEEDIEGLKNFVRVETFSDPGIAKKQYLYEKENQKFKTKENIDTEVSKLSQDAEALKNEMNNFMANRVSIQEMVKKIEAYPENLKGSEQYNSLVEEYNKMLEDDKKASAELENKRQSIIANDTALKAAAGNYVKFREGQGSFQGAMWNKAMGGAGKTLSGLYDLQIEAALNYSLPGLIANYVGGEDWDNLLKTIKYGEYDDTKVLPFNPKESLRGIFTKLLGDTNVTEEYVSKIEREGNIVQRGILGLAESTPAMLGGPLSPVLMGAMVTDALDQEMMNDPDLKDLSELEKMMVKAPIGIVSGILEKVGLKGALKGTALVKTLTGRAISKLPINATAAELRNATLNEIKNMGIKSSVALVGSALSEAETGLLQQGAEYGIKDIYNLAKGKKMFDTPEFFSQKYFNDIIDAALTEAVGGVVIGVPNSIAAAFKKDGFRGLDDETFKIFEQLAKDNDSRKFFVTDLKNKINSGQITGAQGKEIINAYDQAAGMIGTVDDEITDVESRKIAMDLISERKKLEAKRDKMDPGLAKPIQKRIDQINEQLSKLTEDAIQKQTGIPTEISNLKDDELIEFKVTSLEDVPEEFRDRATKKEGVEVEGRMLILGLPIGPKKTKVIGEAYTYSLTGKEAKDYAIQKQAAGEVSVQPEAGAGQEVEIGGPEAKPKITPEESKRKEDLVAALEATDKDVIAIGDELLDRKEAQTELEAITQKEQAPVTEQGGMEQTPAKITPEEIEQKRQGDLKKSPVSTFMFKKINPNGENLDVNDKQKDTIERIIQQAIEAGKTADEIVGVLNAAGYVATYPGNTGAADVSLRTYLENRLAGTEKRNVNEYASTDIHAEIKTKYDAELAALQPSETTPTEVTPATEVTPTEVTPATEVTPVEQQFTEQDRARKAELEEAMRKADKRRKNITVGETTMPKSEAKAELDALNQKEQAAQQPAAAEVVPAEVAPVETRTAEQEADLLEELLTGKKKEPTTEVKAEPTSKEAKGKKSKFIDEKGRVNVEEILKTLSDKFSIPFEIINDPDQNYSGKFEDGRVYVNLAYVTAETPWHEFAHPFIEQVKADNPNLYNSLKEEILNTDYGKKILSEVESLYPELNKEDQIEEAIVETIARFVTGKIPDAEISNPKNKTLLGKIIDFINGIRTAIAKAIGLKDNKNINIASLNNSFKLKDFAQMMQYGHRIDLQEYAPITGKKPILVNSKLKYENVKQLKNQYTVGDLNGVIHNIGAFMNNTADVLTVKDAVKNLINLLSNGNVVELASFSGLSDKFSPGGPIGIKFKSKTPVIRSYLTDINSYLIKDKKGRFKRVAGNSNKEIYIRTDLSKNIKDYDEVFIGATVNNIEEIIINTNIDNELKETIKELSDLTGAPIVQNNQTIYEPSTKREYKPESVKYSKFTPTSLADEVRKNLKIKGPGGLQSNILGIPIAIWNAGVETAAKAIEAGVVVSKAIQQGANDVKNWIKKNNPSLSLSDAKIKNKILIDLYENTIKIARENNVKTEGLITYFKRKGLSDAQIDILLKDEKKKAEKPELSEETLPGYTKLMNRINDIIARGRRNGKTDDDIMKGVIANVESRSPEYANATDQQREQIIRDIRKMFGKKEKAAPSAEKITGKPKPKKVTVNEMTALKDQLRLEAKAAREAKGDLNAKRKMLAAAIKEMVKKGKITVRQAAVLINKVNSVNLDNPVMVERMLDYAEKVFNNAEFVEKMSRARKLLKTAKENVRTKIGVSKGLTTLMDKLFNINPNIIPDDVLESYLELVEMMGKRQAVLTLKEAAELTKDVEKVLNAVIDELSTLDDLIEIFDNYNKKVVDENGKIDFSATLDKMLEDGIITANDVKLYKKYKDKVLPKEAKEKKSKEQLAEEKNNLIDAIKQTQVDESKLGMREERDAARKLFDAMTPENLAGLTNAELANLLKVLDNINNGFFPHYAMKMTQKLNSVSRKATLGEAIANAGRLPITKLIANIKSLFPGAKTANMIMVIESPKYVLDQVFGFFKTSPIYDSVFKPLTQAFSSYKTDARKVKEKLDKAFNKVARSYMNNPAKIKMSQFKMMTYALQLEYNSNKDKGEGFYSAAEYIKETIKHAGSNQSTMSKKDKKLLGKVLELFGAKDADGNFVDIDIDRLELSFNNAEKQALKTIQEVNLSLRDKAMFTAAVIHGGKIEPIDNYVSHNVLPTGVANKKTSSVYDEMNTRMMPSTKAATLKERTEGVKPLNFNIFGATQRSANQVLMDFNLTEAVRTSRMVLNELGKDIMENGTDKQQSIFNAINDSFKTTLENTLMNTFNDSSFTDKVISMITKQAYRILLAGVTRWTAELMSNLAYVAKVGPLEYISGVTKYRKYAVSEKGPAILRNIDSAVQDRVYEDSVLSGRMIDSSIMDEAIGLEGTTSNYMVVNAMQTIYNNTLKKGQNFVAATADTLISTPDKAMMRPFYFGLFAKEFKKITGQDVNFDKISENDEAYLKKFKEAIEKSKDAADYHIMLAGGTKNPFASRQKAMTLKNATVSAQIYQSFNNFMNNFIIGEYIAARTGIYAMMGSGKINQRRGAAVLAGVVARMTSYTFLIKELGRGLAWLFLGDDDEEDEEKSLIEKAGQAFAGSMTSLILGRDFGNMTRSMINYGVEKVNENYVQDMMDGKYTKEDVIAYNSLIPSSLNTRPQFSDLMINMSGSGQPFLRSLKNLYENSFAAEAKGEDTIKKRENYWKYTLPLEAAGHLGFVPLYKDVRAITNKALQGEVNAIKEAKEEEKVGKAEAYGGYKTLEEFEEKDPIKYDEYSAKGGKLYKYREDERKEFEEKNKDKPFFGHSEKKFKELYPKDWAKYYGPGTAYFQRQNSPAMLQKKAQDEIRKAQLEQKRKIAAAKREQQEALRKALGK